MVSSIIPYCFKSREMLANEAYILLVDDQDQCLSRLEELVKRSGFACVSARSGTEALRACDQRRPRVVVTDLSMPNLDGIALARWLRSRHPSVPLILMTGQAIEARSLAELKKTFTAVLRKPIEIDHFLDLIERLMPISSNRRPDPSRP